MRIIAGTARGRRLVAPKGQKTRPTPDRVREALFSILANEVKGAKVLDLFAGTGALGLEALSRGAAHAVFVDKDRAANTLLQKNIAAVVGTSQSARVLNLQATLALALLAEEGAEFAMAFLDPPYRSQLLPSTMGQLATLRLVTGLMIAEHAGADAPPEAPDGWYRDDCRRFGDVALTFFRLKGATP